MLLEPGEIRLKDEQVIPNFSIEAPNEATTEIPIVEVDSDEEFRGKVLRPTILEQNKAYNELRSEQRVGWEDQPFGQTQEGWRKFLSLRKGQPRWRREAMRDPTVFNRYYCAPFHIRTNPHFDPQPTRRYPWSSSYNLDEKPYNWPLIPKCKRTLNG